MPVTVRPLADSMPHTKCPGCQHYEATIADLQSWAEDLRQSRDRWRELALNGADHSPDKFASTLTQVAIELKNAREFR